MTDGRKKVHHPCTSIIARSGVLYLLNQCAANHYSVGQAGNGSRIIRGFDTETNGNRQIAV
jgi:hypothetical protein